MFSSNSQKPCWNTVWQTDTLCSLCTKCPEMLICISVFYALLSTTQAYRATHLQRQCIISITVIFSGHCFVWYLLQFVSRPPVDVVLALQRHRLHLDGLQLTTQKTRKNQVCSAVSIWAAFLSGVSACRPGSPKGGPLNKYFVFGSGAKYCGHHVCMSVCVILHISKSTGPNFTKFSIYVTYGLGSVIFWWQCDTLWFCRWQRVFT